MRSIGCAGSDLFSIIAVSDDADVSRVIGEVVCGITPDAEVALSVEDASQGDGIGRALLMAVEVQAVQYGVRNMFGHIWSTNNAIRNLAATLGYVVDRTGGSWDSCILRKSLSVVAPRGKIICRTAKLTLAPELASSDGQALQALADQ
jgi:GNAT superfamily N-acetyltransferase